MSKSNLKIVVIGCGRIGTRHAENINNLARLAAVCDVNTEAAEHLASGFGCRSYSSIESLLKTERFDLAAICTPNGLHAEHTLACLEGGVHVLCEKPMALNSMDCQQMIDCADANDRKLFIVKQNRYNPPIVALKKAVDDGLLGRIFNVQLNCFWNRNPAYYTSSDWKGRRDLDGGTLFTQFSHFIDLMYWIAGDVEDLHAMGANYIHQGLIEFEDTGVIALKFKSGAVGTINYTVNCFDHNMEGSITVFGEKGTVKVGGQYLNALEYQAIDQYQITHVDESRPANDYGTYRGSMSNHDKVYENVVAVLEGNGEIGTTGEEGQKTVEIIERIYARIQESCSVAEAPCSLVGARQ